MRDKDFLAETVAPPLFTSVTAITALVTAFGLFNIDRISHNGEILLGVTIVLLALSLALLAFSWMYETPPAGLYPLSALLFVLAILFAAGVALFTIAEKPESPATPTTSVSS